MKNKIIVGIFIVFLGTGFILSILIPDQEISFYERRKLTNIENLKETFPDQLDDYMSDQFPGRNLSLKISSIWNRYFLLNKEYNDVYIKDGSIIEKNYPVDEKSVDGFIDKINKVSKKYQKNSNIYYTIIPDKSYFLEEGKHLKIDFASMIEKVTKKVEGEYIDILNEFTLEDYFKTDIHLKQNAYFKVIPLITEKMNLKVQKQEYEKYTIDNFYGASFSKAPYLKSEQLNYYSNQEIKRSLVTHLEYGIKDVYDLTELDSVDFYNIFLSGPSALIEIENIESESKKELIVFRDSFGSSFVPLLTPYYKKITVVDLRYISDEKIEELVSFDNKDILFMYSTLLVNNSEILKVKK